MKRLFDFVTSAAGLLVLFPIIVIAAAVIRIETPGNPIFSQKRVGRFGAIFTCYKLRTMHANTGDIPTHEVKGASVTQIGSWLRRWKIDELPQLLNVLKGEMSLVGPRPCLISQTALIEARRKQGVLEVMPGITGLSQISGVDMSDPEKLASLDARYAKTANFRSDFTLLAATFLGAGVGVDRIARELEDN
jgi:O-antigen biosynthesis protein WbqP